MSLIRTHHLGYLGFVTIGMTSTVIGPTLPFIMEEFGLTFTVAGTLFLLHWTGYFLAVILGGVGSDFLGKKPFLLGGASLLVTGLCALGLGQTDRLVFLGMTLTGAGFGALDGGLNGLIIDISGERKGLGLGILHMFFGVGALAGPFVATLSLQTAPGWRGAFLCTAGLGALFIILLSPREIARADGEDRIEVADVTTLAKSPLMLLFSLLLIAYVGAEQGITGWLPAYMMGERGASQPLAAWSLSLFWIGLTAGRLLVGLVSERVGYAQTVLLLSCGAALFVTLALAIPEVTVSMWLFGLAGLFFSGTVPTVMAQAGSLFRQYSGTVSGMLTAACGAGAMALPAGMGVVSDWFGLSAGLATALGALVAVVILSLWNLLRSRASLPAQG